MLTSVGCRVFSVISLKTERLLLQMVGCIPAVLLQCLTYFCGIICDNGDVCPDMNFIGNYAEIEKMPY
jgi:hypothetical protein